MGDYIVRAMAGNEQIRAYAATTRELVEEARQRHQTYPVATAALGRLLTAGAMMGSMMKGDKDLLTLQIQCSGPIGGLTVTADTHGNVKGFVKNPEVDLPPSPKGKLDVGKALDMGVLSVMRDLGLKDPYIGQTQLTTGEIGDDLTFYFATSEQTPSSVGLGVLMNKDNTVKQAGGFIIQLMPFADDVTVDRLEKKLRACDPVTTMLDRGMTPEDILKELLGEFGLEFIDTLDTRFHCNCSKERVAKAVISLGKKEIESLIAEDKPVEVNCHFCNSHYLFEKDELKEMLKVARR
ncbi:MAG: Hsp33 family molecular chaperone HslO [Lachnospiraceae bacterium]|nr:Hsp33 family molecular chaperone HslO [Lachnospiraceae bacterium]